MNDTEPKFFAEFNALIADTPLDQIQTYLRWHLLHAYAGTSLPEAFEKESWNFYSHTSQRRRKAAGALEALHQPHRSRDGGGARPGLRRQIFPARGQAARAEHDASPSKQAMGKDIDGLDWMSAETKAKAKEKLHTVMNKIGYPDKWRDYSKLDIVRGDPLGNQERVREFNLTATLPRSASPSTRANGTCRRLPSTPTTIRSRTTSTSPPAYFQPPFFSDKEDDAANYGDMGSTIGHELTHGFDDEGRQYDKDGNLKEWWTKDDEEKFNRARRSAWSSSTTPSKPFPACTSTAS